MQTFLFPPTSEDTSNIANQIIRGLTHILNESMPLNTALEYFYRILQNTSHIDAILITYATEHREEENFFIYPECISAKNIDLNSTSEQLLALRNGPDKVVRIGNQEDHGITLNLINRLFPSSVFDAMIMRSIILQRVIYSFSFIHFGKSPYFTDRDVTIAFAIFDELSVFLSKYAVVGQKKKTMPEETRFLPITRLPGMEQVTEMLWHVARQDCPVLLLGESGVGKESVAETLYLASARVGGAFVKMNCGSLPDTLIDSELFGHEKGAFTGAVHTRKGIFERAHRGMLLLDEIGELPLLAQTRLLRVLQEGVLERVGGSEEQHIDVRIIAATHRNLNQMVHDGTFRADLYFRLNVFPIAIPPLRERPEDIPILISFFIANKCRKFGVRDFPEPSKQNLQELLAYPWPGNVRELNNAVERAVILWTGNMHRPFSISTSEQFMPASFVPLPGKALSRTKGNDGRPETLETLDEAIIRHIRKALEISEGKISGLGGAAQLLDIHPNTLRAKMLKLGIVS